MTITVRSKMRGKGKRKPSAATALAAKGEMITAAASPTTSAIAKRSVNERCVEVELVVAMINL